MKKALKQGLGWSMERMMRVLQSLAKMR